MAIAHGARRSSSWANVTEKNILIGADRFLDRCGGCHGGPNLADDRFHNTGLAQLGPGLGDGPAANDDFGRARVVGTAEKLCGNPPMFPASCKYAFRTMPIRNIALTAPYGHAGQFGRYGNAEDFATDLVNDIAGLREFVAYYSIDARDQLRAYSAANVDPELRATVVANTEDIVTHISPFFAKASTTLEEDVDPITAFLVATTSIELLREKKIVRCDAIPTSVPSGLPLDVGAYDCL